MPRNIPDLYPLDAYNSPPQAVKQAKMFPDIARCPLGSKTDTHTLSYTYTHPHTLPVLRTTDTKLIK